MTTFEKEQAQEHSLGFFVHFECGTNQYFKVTRKFIGPFKAELHIELPNGKRDKWIPGIAQLIDNVQCGNNWPLRIQWVNARDFFTLEQLISLDNLLSDISIYLYGIRDSRAAYIESLYRSSQAERMRLLRSARRAKQHST